jgi:hypothetical protein
MAFSTIPTIFGSGIGISSLWRKSSNLSDIFTSLQILCYHLSIPKSFAPFLSQMQSKNKTPVRIHPVDEGFVFSLGD